MIRALPVADLVSQSDYIVIGEVREIEIEGTESSKMGVIKILRNEVTVIDSLKGTWPIDQPMIFRTVKAEHWIEDNVEFPFPGTRLVLFVKKKESGGLSLVNGIQGLWPMQGDQLLRMGTGKTLEEIRSMIKDQAEPGR